MFLVKLRSRSHYQHENGHLLWLLVAWLIDDSFCLSSGNPSWKLCSIFQPCFVSDWECTNFNFNLCHLISFRPNTPPPFQPLIWPMQKCRTLYWNGVRLYVNLRFSRFSTSLSLYTSIQLSIRPLLVHSSSFFCNLVIAIDFLLYADSLYWVLLLFLFLFVMWCPNPLSCKASLSLSLWITHFIILR